MTGLVISSVKKSLGGREILRGVDFMVEPKALIAILGASGSGKTTLLRLIAGFERPDSGTIQLNGQILAGPGIFTRPEHRGIGYVAQEGALFPHLNVAANITFGLPRAQRRARHRVGELLRLVGLPESYADRAAESLSGGEQQRIALARALAPDPKLILLDEPFSALDAGLRAETRLAVCNAITQAGATAILVTHDQAEALSMASRVGILQNGCLGQLATPEKLYHTPASPALAAFLGDAVFAPAIAADGHITSRLGIFPLPQGTPLGPVELMIRPEQIALSATSGGIPATVDTVSFFGHDALVNLSLGTEHITARVFSHAAPQAGAQVWVNITGPVNVFPKRAAP